MLIDGAKVFDKIEYLFMIKTLSKPGVEGNLLTLIKDIYKKSIANVILNGEKLKDVLLRLRTRQGCPLSPLLFSIVL